ncbi:MAG: hypothetical protein N2C14_13975, partial [Planctomycetales bacterium]
MAPPNSRTNGGRAHRVAMLYDAGYLIARKTLAPYSIESRTVHVTHIVPLEVKDELRAALDDPARRESAAHCQGCVAALMVNDDHVAYEEVQL